MEFSFKVATTLPSSIVVDHSPFINPSAFLDSPYEYDLAVSELASVPSTGDECEPLASPINPNLNHSV